LELWGLISGPGWFDIRRNPHGSAVSSRVKLRAGLKSRPVGVEMRSVTPRSSKAPHIPKVKPKVGLDKPCSQCGQPIYFNYRGPIDGICGRCTDRALASRKRSVNTRTRVVQERSAKGALIVTLILGIVLGAIALYFLTPFFRG
jgi:hypothetical protein